MDTDVPKPKYCEKSPRNDPQGKNPHIIVKTTSSDGIELMAKRLSQTYGVGVDGPEAGQGIDAPWCIYRNVVELIDKVQIDKPHSDPAGCIVELCTIAQVQVRWMQDHEERLSLYELIIKRISETIAKV